MGTRRACVLVVRMVLPFLPVFAVLSGCQVGPGPSHSRLVEQRELVDESGLLASVSLEPLRVNICPPAGWHTLGMQKTALYTHRQWRSPSMHTAVGVTYIRLPLPLSAQTVAWFASNEASKHTSGGKLIRRWRDSVGREWFEAENDKYHMTGYVMVSGLNAWINYYGYRTTAAQETAEVDLSRRSLDTIVPDTNPGPVARLDIAN